LFKNFDIAPDGKHIVALSYGPKTGSA